MTSSLIDKFVESLKPLANTTRIRSYGKYRVLTMIFRSEFFIKVVEEVDKLTYKVALNGEKIKCFLTEGTVTDMGRETLKILEGAYFEVYEYEKTKVYFIRVYLYSNGFKKWVSLYMDENPETPWWSKAERNSVNKDPNP